MIAFHYYAPYLSISVLSVQSKEGIHLPLFLLFFQNHINQMLHRSELIPEVRNVNKTNSKLSDKSKELSRSSVSSKCLTTEEGLQGQIVQLKEKAHQSFMQVIQMQQLHQEELEQLRNEFAERELEYQRTIEDLKAKSRPNEQLQMRVKQLQFQNTTLQKNYKHHNCDFIENDLSIDNIELITCRQESKLDDSAIINFTEIISLNQHDQQIRCFREEIKREMGEVMRRIGGKYEDSNVSKLMDRLFGYIKFVKEEYCKLQDRQDKQEKSGMEKEKEKEKEKQKQKEEKELQNSKFYESLQKQTKFMTEHIKRLSTQKMKVENKLLETQRQVKIYEQKIKRIEASLSKRGIRLQELTPKTLSPLDRDPSPQISSISSPNHKSISNPTHKSQYGLLHKSKN